MLLFNKAFSLVVFFTSLLLSFGAKSEAFMVYGAYHSCSEWNKITENNTLNNISDSAATFWLAGYMSALNEFSGRDYFPDIDAGIASEYIKSYCKKNPDKDSVDGIVEMIKKLKIKK